jgi:hypothetical protein
MIEMINKEKGRLSTKYDGGIRQQGHKEILQIMKITIKLKCPHCHSSTIT